MGKSFCVSRNSLKIKLKSSINALKNKLKLFYTLFSLLFRVKISFPFLLTRKLKWSPGTLKGKLSAGNSLANFTSRKK